MTTASEPTANANDRIIIAMSALGLLAVVGVLTGHTHAGIVDSIVKGITWIAKNSSALRAIANGVLSIANGLAAIWA